jgi:hypothetical protein
MGKRIDHSGAIALYGTGVSVADVATAEGITRTAMYQWLKRHGVNFRPRLRYGKDNHFYRGGSTESDPAQNKLEKAIKRGTVQKKDVCEKCGHTGKFRDGRSAIQAHHPNYNEPYNVMWLCQRCHHEWHKNNRAIQKGEVVCHG